MIFAVIGFFLLLSFTPVSIKAASPPASAVVIWGQARLTASHRGAHFNSLVPYRLSEIDPMAGLMDASVKVKVRKFL